MALQSYVGDLGCFFSFFIYTQTVGLLGRGISPSKAATYTQNNIHNKRTQTCMPRVGFEPTVLVFERAKTAHIVERAATVIGEPLKLGKKNSIWTYMMNIPTSYI
jgi:hypothetical protein